MSVGKGDFDKAHELSAGNEGGISSDTSDTGNYLEIEGNEELSEIFVATRYGQTFENWLSANGRSNPSNKAGFEKLAKEFSKETREDVLNSFKKQYWDKYNLGDIADERIASNVYDAMINQGYTLGGGGTHATLANVLNSLGYEVDGDKDFSTNEIAITALNKAIEEKGAEAVNTAYSNQREKSYMGSKTVDSHGKGWLKRLNSYREDADQYNDEELDGMAFTNDSTSNMAVLSAIRTDNSAQVAGVSQTANQEEEYDHEGTLNTDNSKHLEVHDLAKTGSLDDSDTELIQALAEEQRIQWSKIGTPGVADTMLNASGVQKNKLGVDDDYSNIIMRAEVIDGLSEGLDMNTNDGKRKLRDRIEAYTVHLKSDEFTEKVASLNTGVRETSFQNMIEDLSFHPTILINEANEKFELTGSGAITPTGAVSANVDVEGVIGDNSKILTKLAENDPKLAEEIARDGMDAVATKLAVAQRGAAEKGETDVDAATLLKLADWEKDKAVGDKALSDGVSAMENIDFEDQEEYEEEENTDDLLNEASKHLSESEGKERRSREERRGRRMHVAEKVLTGLKAAAGIISLSKALREPDIETPELSPLIMEAVDKQRQLSKSGLTSAEKSAAMDNLNTAYAGAMKNVLRASGGQRGLFLANQGTVDANRIAGLNQLAAQDAALHRQNIQQYNQMTTSVGQMKLQRDMTIEQMRQATMSNNRQTLSGIGGNLVSEALSDASWYMNPNRSLMEQAKSNALKNVTDANGNPIDTSEWNFNVGGADPRSSNNKKSQEEKDAEKANQKVNKK